MALLLWFSGHGNISHMGEHGAEQIQVGSRAALLSLGEIVGITPALLLMALQTGGSG